MLVHDFLTLVDRGMPGTGCLAWQGDEAEPEHVTWGISADADVAPDAEGNIPAMLVADFIPEAVARDLLVMKANRHFGLRCLTVEEVLEATKPNA